MSEIANKEILKETNIKSAPVKKNQIEEPKKAEVAENGINEGEGSKNKTGRDRKTKFLKDKRARLGEWKEDSEPRVKSDEPRKPKKKVALFMSYNGSGYQGMQVNPGARTIEEDLFKALCEAGAVSKDNSDDIRKISFMRSARTDKGVSAAGQVVSFKISFNMIIEDEDIVKKINEKLPKEIKVFGFVKAPRPFHSKNLCDSRIYEYLLPTYVFSPPKKYEKVEDLEEGKVPEITKEEIDELYKFRITNDILLKVREALKVYQGVRNYHNFTIRRQFAEQASKRYIYTFEASEPFIKDDLEWLSLKVHGQSFMMHQIRKMVAMMVMVVRSETPIDIISKAFGETKINIPKVPGLGLLLEKPIYKSYNQKNGGKDDFKDITFEPYKEEMEEFKQKEIYPIIYEVEFKDKVFADFIKSIDYFSEYFTYINKEGILYPKPDRPENKNFLKEEEDDDEDGGKNDN